MLGNRLPTMRLVLTTCVDQASADQLARHLLEQRLAACVSLLPTTSYYHWQGELQHEREVQLVIKTSADQLSNLLETLTRHHSYEVPELVVLEASAAGPYGAWLRNTVGIPP
ncbi:MAG: divalent-cation tolerance protein CutA [Synechococcus sp. SB0668_bin_15]|nr:divalent-cation tolerance protein CutA [Synechococcus sp. SB0668_bin_15]MXZ82593.1 divalent-cation tolerance protein CutA [Synechococcus sp. SB0666_bin_14]MYA90534.1 divalent-cation tolerance protein CutA [Synechococcus sp. SB0663_bin_10]MYC50548.1 divalent-cation tolerance protein CutA [Synechococcus sp. SB0662_bin_14]MYG46020.1 divalent-cation tolerance protein CutA [Synechococcus sp. SB0675_bin_6]MYJ59098.1 divalent-cation tolerance protein CutA [Synechococcus sp. SB0672_bin_6]MYK91042.